MKKFLIILLVGICSLSAFVVFAETNFGQNLSMGSSGTDVFNLQKLLNSDSETQVSDSGEGSPGKETNYFGKKTKTALEKFQTKYSDNVLKPLGLTTATGFLGQTTRTFINEHFGTTTEETSTEEKKVPV